ncbi:MAG: DUF4296 domain-containing protein [Bacteroidota bacterium]
MKKGLILIALCIVAACESGIYTVPAPKKLLTKDQMVSILTELTIIESSVELNYVQHQDYLKTIKTSGQKLLKRHKISEKDFESNMNYYGSQQEIMQGIYSSVLDSLNLRSGQISNEK